MRIVPRNTAHDFLERALPWLMEAEAENNLTIGIALARADGDPPGEEPAFFATVEDDARVVGTLFRTPPHMLGFSPMPLEGVPLVDEVAAARWDALPGAVGPEAPVESFAKLWSARHGVAARVEMRMGIYHLQQVAYPDPAPAGAMREPRIEEKPLLVEWMEGFERDTGIFSTGAETMVARMLEAGALRLWEDAGRPVSMAGASGTTPRGIRIGYVYTPPDLRGRGYAKVLTAALSQRLLDQGRRFCFLYTNLADPVSNGIYRRIGYEQVATAVAVRFEG
jgi:GNAT superfamily N-acetyltransferase